MYRLLPPIPSEFQMPFINNGNEFRIPSSYLYRSFIIIIQSYLYILIKITFDGPSTEGYSFADLSILKKLFLEPFDILGLDRWSTIKIYIQVGPLKFAMNREFLCKIFFTKFCY